MAVGLDKMEMDEPDLIRSVAALGGGIALAGRACGCLTGGVAAISRLLGKSNPDESDDPAMWSLSQKMNRRFEELTKEHGGVDCAQIARVNWSDQHEVKGFNKSPDGQKETVCAPLVGDTAKALGELLEAHRQKQA